MSICNTNILIWKIQLANIPKHSPTRTFICPVTRLKMREKNKQPFAAISEVDLVILPHIQMLSTSNFPSPSLTYMHASIDLSTGSHGRVLRTIALKGLASHAGKSLTLAFTQMQINGHRPRFTQCSTTHQQPTFV